MVKKLITVLLACAFMCSCATQRKVVLSGQTPLSKQLTKENTEYVLNRAIDLEGNTILFPKGANVVFKRGGCIYNGKIIGDETILKNPRLKKIRFGGSFLNTKITLSDQFDGETDFWGLIQAFPHAEIVLSKNISLPPSKVSSIEVAQFHLDGLGHTVTVHRCPVLKNTDVKIINTRFDCLSAVERVIYALGEVKTKVFVMNNCIFTNVSEVCTVSPRSYQNVIIENCQISGLLKEDSRSTNKHIYQIRIHSCTGKVIVRNNAITNCFGAGIAGQYFNPDDSTFVLVENNVIDNVAGGGIIFVSGAVRNAVVRGNRISRTHSLGKRFESEIDGGPSSAINFHGFFNTLVENNVITDCPNSSSLDFDGSLKGESRVVKGTGLIVRGNRITGSGPVAFLAVEDAEVSNNVFEGNVFFSSGAAIYIMGSSNFRIHDNDLTYKRNNGDNVYPIYIKDANDIKSGNVRIEDNMISSDGNNCIYVGANFSGECRIDDNAVLNMGDVKKNLEVVNKSKSKVHVHNTRTLIKK